MQLSSTSPTCSRPHGVHFYDDGKAKGLPRRIFPVKPSQPAYLSYPCLSPASRLPLSRLQLEICCCFRLSIGVLW